MIIDKGAVESRRLFFGLWPDSAVRIQLAQAATALMADATGKVVPPGGLHLTLFFLGRVTPDQQVCVEAAASMVRENQFELVLDRFGYFRRPRVAWIGCSDESPSLVALSGRLGDGCRACGFSSENRDYTAHVTIARQVSRDPGRPMMLAVPWLVDRFALIESVSAPGGVEYRPLRFWPLARS